MLHHVLWLWLWPWSCDTFLHFPLYSKSKEKKRNINNDLAILPSYDTTEWLKVSWLGKIAELLFIFTFLLDLLHRKKCRKVLCHKCHIVTVTVITSHDMSHDKCGKLVHRPCSSCVQKIIETPFVTNFIWSYLHQFFEDSHGLKASLKPLRRPFNRCQSCLKAINNGRDIKQINW